MLKDTLINLSIIKGVQKVWTVSLRPQCNPGEKMKEAQDAASSGRWLS